MTGAVRSVTVLTHSRPQQIARTLEQLIAEARACGVLLRFDCDETRKLGLRPQEGIVCDAEPSHDVQLCIVLGGDGTILRGLRQYARTSVPIFAVNFGEIGFLATLDPDDIDGYSFAQAFEHDFEVLRSRSTPAAGGSPRSTTSPFIASSAGASRSSPTASRARRSDRCAATASSSAPPPARRATTSPTAGP